MLFSIPTADSRRDFRVAVDSLCSELLERDSRPARMVDALMVDLSEHGLRIERPYLGGRLGRRVQLEIEIPEVDEIVWAAAASCYDRITRRGAGGRLIRSSGFRIIAAAPRQQRLIRDYVAHAREMAHEEASWAMRASCYTRG
jgi:hypothetical protein